MEKIKHLTMKRLLSILIFFVTIIGCTGENFPENIDLSCECIEGESDGCNAENKKINVDFKKNNMTFGSKVYKNLGTTPTSISGRDNLDFVVLNRQTQKLTFERNKIRNIYQCKKDETL